MHCKACNAEIQNPKEDLCLKCLTEALRLIPSDLMELMEMAIEADPKSTEEVAKDEQWIINNMETEVARLDPVLRLVPTDRGNDETRHLPILSEAA